ncbi:hypothetical protein F5887DRAFT_1277607 [Amanita rubescens]|nr:hypothetical protein F5887DRAFT_1277607 [Amanita rubescens]
MAKKRKSDQVKAESPLTCTPTSEDGHISAAKKARLSADAQADAQPPSRVSTTNIGEPEAIHAPASAPPASTQAATKIAKKFVKHDTHWLLDGNTLVQIGETRFRLHRSTLVGQSKWFREMIENPPHDRCIYADEETSATVYCLDSLDVSVKDFVALLNALDDAILYAYTPPSLRNVAAIFRAADALEFDKFRAYAISYLEDQWPNDISELTTDRVKYAADTVLLARRRNINSVLKRALYELVRAEGFMQETTGDDGDGEADSDQSALSASDISLLLYTREQLTTFWMGKIHLPAQASKCISPVGSQSYKNCVLRVYGADSMYKTLILGSKVFEKYRYDPICGLDAFCDAPWVCGETWPLNYGKDLPTSNSGYLCSACATKWRSIWREEQNKLWDDMDTWFELNVEEEQDNAEE